MRASYILLLPLSLIATVNEPLRVEFFPGYRNDHVHWHLQHDGALLYSEKYRNLQFWENGLALQTIHRDLVFYVRGAYAVFGKGNVLERYAGLSFTTLEPHFHFDTDAWACEGLGYFGYAVNLTTDRTYRVLFIPLVGYSGHWERVHRKHGKPDPWESQDAIGADALTMRSSLSHPLHQRWYGFLLGCALRVDPGGRWTTQMGYSYHFLHFMMKTHYASDVSLVNAGSVLVSEVIERNKVRVSQGGQHAHSGWVGLEYRISQSCRVGGGGVIRYFPSNVLQCSLRKVVEERFPASSLSTTLPSEKLKLRWTQLSLFLQFSWEL